MTTVTLKTLDQLGLCRLGDEFQLIYANDRHTATLTKDGLYYKGMTFETPSGWALHVIRLTNPTRRAVDGWRCVQYKGKVLATYMEAAKQLLAKDYGHIDEVGIYPAAKRQRKEAKRVEPLKGRATLREADTMGGSTSTQSHLEPDSSGDDAVEDEPVHCSNQYSGTMSASGTPKPQHRRKGRPQLAV